MAAILNQASLNQANINRRDLLVGGAVALIGLPCTAAAADVVGVGMISRTLFYLPLWCATHAGFMKAEGLEIQLKNPDTSAEVNKMLRTGEVQIVLRSPEAAMMDANRGGSLRVIGGGISKLPHFIIANPRIKTLADLRGANFGILAEKEGTTHIVQDITKSIGLTPADYKMTVVGGSPARWRLLREGKIDVGLQPIPNSYEAEAAGFTNLGSVIPFVPDWQFTAVNADQKWAQPNRNTVVRFLRALQKGREYLKTNPQETALIAAEELRSNVTLTARMLVDIEKYGMFDPQTAINVAGLRRVHETLQKIGDIPANQAFDLNAFTDLSYYQQSRDPVVTGSVPVTGSIPAR
ncbi:MAG TPA: ABC transporter substrate-binding protein [Xanthobacteraceae bacterium]|jgi:ABC-type nitrate/sulfonate/bicarbonate transport system substrate-binding protein|nr:ABC transporter substrate-binding protein [Xanthobacteraceae bacterium]